MPAPPKHSGGTLQEVTSMLCLSDILQVGTTNSYQKTRQGGTTAVVLWRCSPNLHQSGAPCPIPGKALFAAFSRPDGFVGQLAPTA